MNAWLAVDEQALESFRLLLAEIAGGMVLLVVVIVVCLVIGFMDRTPRYLR